MSRNPAPGKGRAAGRRDLEEIKRPLQAFLRAKGLHDSKVRDLVVDTFLSAEDHMDLAAMASVWRRCTGR